MKLAFMLAMNQYHVDAVNFHIFSRVHTNLCMDNAANVINFGVLLGVILSSFEMKKKINKTEYVVNFSHFMFMMHFEREKS